MSNKKNLMGWGKSSRGLATVLTLFLSLGAVSEAGAMNCTFTPSGTDTDGNTTYSLVVNGSTGDTSFTRGSCNDNLPEGYSKWDDVKKQLTSASFKNVTSIGGSTFKAATKLTSVTIPEGVTSIGGSAFAATTNLTNITLPKSLTSISSYAFSNGAGLTSINIPDGVTSIENYTFHGDTNLTSVTIPNSVTSIGSSAFQGATNLTDIIIPDSVTSIGVAAFKGATSLTSVVIPEGVTSIGNHTFYGDTNLTSVTIPDGVTSIGWSAFASTGLTSVTIPDSVTSIGEWAFASTSLTSVTIPYGVETISKNAFEGVTGLTSVTIPGSLTTIGDDIFSGITGLTRINCAGTEDECEVLRAKFEGYLATDGSFERITPVTKCSSYTATGACEGCYSTYAFADGTCKSCGAGTNCHWDEDKEAVVFDSCRNKYLRQENGCVAASTGCSANFRFNDGECDRIRYTPADAAKVLRDDNTNQIVITFKK